MANFVRLLSNQQCLFNLSLSRLLLVFKKNLIKRPEGRIQVWPLYFLKYLLDFSKAYPSQVKFHIERLRNIGKQ